MKQLSRILLTLIAVSLLIGYSACSSSIAANNDPEQLSDLASDIADFDLPAGYKGVFSASMVGYSVVAYNRGSGPAHLYLIQSEKEIDGAKLEQMLSELTPKSAPQVRMTMTVSETTPVIVRDQETTLIISEDINSEGETYRQAMVTFPGKGGPAWLVLSESTEKWDQTELDAFLKSIR